MNCFKSVRRNATRLEKNLTDNCLKEPLIGNLNEKENGNRFHRIDQITKVY